MVAKISEREIKDITVKILKSSYPTIALEISNKITSSFPSKKLTDLSKMDFIVNEFKKYHNLEDLDIWLNPPGKNELTDKREQLAAIIALVYCPSRLFSLKTKLGNGVLAKLCQLTNCPKAMMCQSLSKAVVAYKVYNGFKTEVEGFYSYLISKGIFN